MVPVFSEELNAFVARKQHQFKAISDCPLRSAGNERRNDRHGATAARLMFVRNWTENGLYDNFNVPGLIGNHRFGGAKAVFRSWSIRRLTPIFEFSARALL